MRSFCLCALLLLLLALPARAAGVEILMLGVDARMNGLIEHLAPFFYSESGIALKWQTPGKPGGKAGKADRGEAGTGTGTGAGAGQNCVFDALLVATAGAQTTAEATELREGREILYTEDEKKQLVRYSLLLVRPEQCPEVRQAAAKRFSDWLAGPVTQARINDFRPQNGQVFFPNAKAPSR